MSKTLEIKHFVPLLSPSEVRCCCFSCREKHREIKKVFCMYASSTYLDVSVVLFLHVSLATLFSPYIFFNFIIHFSPVFRARVLSPCFSTPVEINDSGRHFSPHHTRCPLLRTPFPFLIPSKHFWLSNIFSLSSLELRKIAEKKHFCADSNPFPPPFPLHLRPIWVFCRSPSISPSKRPPLLMLIFTQENGTEIANSLDSKSVERNSAAFSTFLCALAFFFSMFAARCSRSDGWSVDLLHLSRAKALEEKNSIVEANGTSRERVVAGEELCTIFFMLHAWCLFAINEFLFSP